MKCKPTVIIILFLILGFTYAIMTPIFEASDELWHYPFVRHLADGNPLPVQDPGNVGPWKQEASQQPLYYSLAAALTYWIDSSDMETVRWLNPHVDNGVLTPDGNTNLVIHQPERETFPWHGTVLAVRLVRFFSVLMGAGTVYFTWRTARIVFPGRPELAWGAAAVNAFTPMFLFISGAVNNDNLAMLLSSAALFLMLHTHTQKSRLQDSLVLGILLGLAALTKTSALGLVPLALLSTLLSIWHRKGPSWQARTVSLVRHSLAIILPIALIAGWWYYRNYRLYGDWLGWNAFIQVLGQRAHPASLRQLWGERWGFSLSYWGLFGGVNIPMPEWIYHALNTTAALALVGLMVYLVRALYETLHPKDGQRIARFLSRVWPLALLTLWTLAILVGLVRWATTTWSSQGRLVFPAISAISILLVTGLFGWLPRSVDIRGVRMRPSQLGVTLLGGSLFIISAVAPFAWIAPAYRPLPSPTDAQIAAIQHPLHVDFGDQIRLLGYDLASSSVGPGEQLDLTLFWEVSNPMQRDWSVFVHLNDPVINAPIAQRDMYLGQGLLATRQLKPGQRLANRYVIDLPGTTYSPAQTELVVGLYDYDNGERMKTADGQDAIPLTQIAIQAPSSTYPNPVHYNFGDQIALIGYQVEPRRLRPGETMALTLVWQALAETEIDYTIFTHLRDLEDPSNRIYAQHDAPPPGGTSAWREGQITTVTYQLTLAEDTPPAVHEIEVGIYHQDADGNTMRLQLVRPDGQIVDDFLILGKVRVD